MESKSERADVVIVGTGVGGLYCALNLPRDLKITLIAKSAEDECDSYLAQGGICMMRGEDDYKPYFEDTMKAGHYENDPGSVDIMVRGSRDVIYDLIRFGVDFERDENGDLAFTREGAHSKPRILFHEDITGKEITRTLLAQVKRRPNITIYENVTMVDIMADGEKLTAGQTPEPVESTEELDDAMKFANLLRRSPRFRGAIPQEEKTEEKPEPKCRGIIALAAPDSAFAAKYGLTDPAGAPALTEDGFQVCAVRAPEVVWACGGIGGLFSHSTNYPVLTGDALAISLIHGIRLENPDYIQIHPTSLYTGRPGRSFLISESVRGEGGILLNEKGERFVNELLPRDVVSRAIKKEMKEEGTQHVWLSMEHIPTDEILHHFKHIYETCLEEGYDCTKVPIPVVPAQHYFMGGVWVDSDSRTSMDRLYAVGETSCNGVHGKNRLASNSLLESLVFAKRAARAISDESAQASFDLEAMPAIDLDKYRNAGKLAEKYHEAVLAEIERMKKYHEQHHHETERGSFDPQRA